MWIIPIQRISLGNHTTQKILITPVACNSGESTNTASGYIYIYIYHVIRWKGLACIRFELTWSNIVTIVTRFLGRWVGPDDSSGWHGQTRLSREIGLWLYVKLHWVWRSRLSVIGICRPRGAAFGAELLTLDISKVSHGYMIVVGYTWGNDIPSFSTNFGQSYTRELNNDVGRARIICAAPPSRSLGSID